MTSITVKHVKAKPIKFADLSTGDLFINPELSDKGVFMVVAWRDDQGNITYDGVVIRPDNAGGGNDVPAGYRGRWQEDHDVILIKKADLTITT